MTVIIQRSRSVILFSLACLFRIIAVFETISCADERIPSHGRWEERAERVGPWSRFSLYLWFSSEKGKMFLNSEIFPMIFQGQEERDTIALHCCLQKCAHKYFMVDLMVVFHGGKIVSVEKAATGRPTLPRDSPSQHCTVTCCTCFVPATSPAGSSIALC